MIIRINTVGPHEEARDTVEFEAWGSVDIAKDVEIIALSFHEAGSESMSLISSQKLSFDQVSRNHARVKATQ